MKLKNRLFLLTFIIYLSFISIGLPDGVLGVAWPSIRAHMGLPLESMGFLTTSLLLMSAFSSIVSGRLMRLMGTGGVTFLSCVLTAGGLLGYGLSPSFFWLLLCTVPLGLGQGAVDSCLNTYVANHYTSRHMNWLHCFWGIGACSGPFLMTCAIFAGSWRRGYFYLAAIQMALAAVLLASVAVKLWDERERSSEGERTETLLEEDGLFKKSDQALATLLFFLYSGIDISIGVWLNSVLMESRHIPVSTAGFCSAFYYASMMAGRFISGLLVMKLGNIKMIRFGLLLAAAGGICMGLSGSLAGALAGTGLIGLGMAPVYPCLMHETPRRFRSAVSQKLIGYEVGAACLGGSVISSAMGLLLSRFSLELLFPTAAALILISLLGNEFLNARAKRLKSRERDASGANIQV